MAKAGTAAGSEAPAKAPARRSRAVARVEEAPTPRSVAIAAAGVTTGEQFASLMSALMSDVIEGRLSPGVSNAAVNAGGKLLKVVEMEYRYGRNGDTAPAPTQPTLSLVRSA